MRDSPTLLGNLRSCGCHVFLATCVLVLVLPSFENQGGVVSAEWDPTTRDLVELCGDKESPLMKNAIKGKECEVFTFCCEMGLKSSQCLQKDTILCSMEESKFVCAGWNCTALRATTPAPTTQKPTSATTSLHYGGFAFILCSMMGIILVNEFPSTL